MGHWQPDGSLEWNPQIQPVLASLNLNIGPGPPLYCAQQNVLTVAAQVGQRGSEWTIKALAAEAASGRYHGFVLNGDISCECQWWRRCRWPHGVWQRVAGCQRY